MNTVISVENLSVSYRNIDAIKNITLSIQEGEFVFIVGPNGAGKTTFLNAVLGFLMVNTGKIKIFGKEIKSAFSKIGFVPQTADIDRNFPITVIETVMTAFLKFGLHPFCLFTKKDKAKALEILKKVDLESQAQNRVSELSGGEFQRLLIARALCLSPEILILDEPTANIDAVSKNKIFSLLKEINAQGVTVITVTHDLSLAAKGTKLICINKELIYCGEPQTTEQISKILYQTDESKE